MIASSWKIPLTTLFGWKVELVHSKMQAKLLKLVPALPCSWWAVLRYTVYIKYFNSWLQNFGHGSKIVGNRCELRREHKRTDTDEELGSQRVLQHKLATFSDYSLLLNYWLHGRNKLGHHGPTGAAWARFSPCRGMRSARELPRPESTWRSDHSYSVTRLTSNWNLLRHLSTQGLLLTFSS
jgi:hypothetical protein